MDERSDYSQDDDDEGSYDESEECSDVSGVDSSGFVGGQMPASYRIGDAIDGTSYAPDDVSYPSFSLQQSEEDLFSLTSSQLPPPVNPELHDRPDPSGILNELRDLEDCGRSSNGASKSMKLGDSESVANTTKSEKKRYGVSVRKGARRSFSSKAHGGDLNFEQTFDGEVEIHFE
jgi:hypothetical protein